MSNRSKRKIIKIDDDKCTGCGNCIPDCPEGALQIIDSKARLIGDLFCDGLGACLGTCPEDAITIEERESEEYNETKVMENIVKKGPNVIKAHLDHLKGHGAHQYLMEALEFLQKNKIQIPDEYADIICDGEGELPHSHLRNKNKKKEKNMSEHETEPCGCPSAKVMVFKEETKKEKGAESKKEFCDAPSINSELSHWPIQLHLVPPTAPFLDEQDVVLAADCTAFAVGDFHQKYLKGKSIAIACPKLDSNKEIYVDKIKQMIDEAKINTLTVMTMEVPCCHGLLVIAQEALKQARRKIPIKNIVVGIKGNIISDGWV